ncbi:MAG: type II secretion/transformation system, G protein [Candidatus Campylobacter infans]|nr:MAG: type II secretion/transformation system, G protein [Candidatus Campylobacter infans]
MKKAFTLIELVFVIVILGILATVAIPKLIVTRDDAEIAKAKSQIAAVRSGIQLKRNEMILSGTQGYPTNLEDGACCFGGILSTRIEERKDDNSYGWKKDTDGTYTINTNKEQVKFTYSDSDGSFKCEGATSDADKKNPKSGKCTTNLY